MATSKEVFALRKSGQLNEAYEMASMLNLDGSDSEIEWNKKAVAWCLIDLCKQAFHQQKTEQLKKFIIELNQLSLDKTDEILASQVSYVNAFIDEKRSDLIKAKNLSKSGDHNASLSIYKSLLSAGDHSSEVVSGISWELYRISKQMINSDPPNYNGAKKLINDYLKLNTERPSLIHSLHLTLADKIAQHGSLSMGIFIQIWGVENLRSDDFDQFIADDGKKYASLAERVVQHAVKDAFSRSDIDALIYIEETLNELLKNNQNNVWLIYSKVKVLLGSNRHVEAETVGLQFVKNKPKEFWSWDILGDVFISQKSDLALSCYAKGLTCTDDLNFSLKLKVKFTELLVKQNYLPQAKTEISEITNFIEQNKRKIPVEIKDLLEQSWFDSTVVLNSNKDFYREKAHLIDDYITDKLPWIKGSIGKRVSRKSNELLTVYIKSDDEEFPLELIVSDSIVKINEYNLGQSVEIKGEAGLDGKFNVLRLQPRNDCDPFDVFAPVLGVVDNVNHEKKLIHFLVNKQVNGIIYFSDLDQRYEVGDALTLRLGKKTTKYGIKYQAVTAKKSTDSLPSEVVKIFSGSVDEVNGMGFTSDDVFIPTTLMAANNVADGYDVSGTALLNFNKKRGEWGWKAIAISSVGSV